MALRHSPVFPVSTDDDLQWLEQSLDDSLSDGVVLEIGGDATVLNSAGEFRWLQQIGRNAGITIEISTDDPIRRELAHIYGFTISGDDSPSSITTRFASPDQDTVVRPTIADQPTVPRGEGTVDASHDRNAETIPRLNQELSPAHSQQEFAESQPSFSFVVTPPVPRRPELAGEEHGYSTATGGRTARPIRRRRSMSRGAIVATMTLTSVIVSVALVLIGFLAPSASVALVPETSEITADLRYGASVSAESLDLTIDPTIVSATESFETSIPTTGERFEPDGTATGSILFTNSATSEVTVPAGTRVTGTDGTDYITQADATVPAADPFSSLTFGSATVAIAAESAGPAGNADAGAVSGQLDASVFYNNREPVSGGTETRIPVVAEEDIEALRAQAQEALTSDPGAAVQSKLSDEQQLITGSVESSDIELSFNHEAGDDAENISVMASVEHSGRAYSPDELHQRASQAIADELDSMTGSERVLLAESVEINEPEPLQEGVPGFRLSASAQTRAILDEAEIDRLRSGLIGASESEARELASSVPGVEAANIRYGPDWLPIGKEPRLKSRISIEIEEHDQQTASQS